MTTKSILVNSNQQLAAAIRLVKGGETILLAPGDYGSVAIKGRNLSDTVTIKSANSNDDAVISGLRIDSSSGFKIEDVNFHRELKSGEALHTQTVFVSSSQRVTFSGVDFTGSLDNNAWNDGFGLRVSNSSKIAVLDSTFRQLFRSAVFANVDDMLVAGNTISEVREGFNFAGVSNVMIAQNRFSQFQPNYAARDHSDAIQVFSDGTTGSSNVTIKNNIITPGVSGGVQGIFIRAEDPASRHSNFVIENNLYYGDARHGISSNGIDNVVIRGNTVVTAGSDGLEAAINVLNSTRILVESNITPMLLTRTNNVDIVLRDNVDLLDRKQWKGLTLEDVFELPKEIRFDETTFVSRTDAGFRAIDGIGSSTFDMQIPSSLGFVQFAVADFLL